MKKLAMFFLIIIVIVVGISYMYINYRANYFEAKRNNLEFASYYQKEIPGTELATIINNAVNQNENNEIQKDSKGKYIDNNEDSIKIDIKILDNDKRYKMETLYSGGMDQFVQYYSEIKFKCTRNRIS